MSKLVSLKTVAPPSPGALRTVIDFDAPGSKSMQGTDLAEVDLYCGQCGALMATGIPKAQAKTAVVRCKLCRAYNDPSTM